MLWLKTERTLSGSIYGVEKFKTFSVHLSHQGWVEVRITSLSLPFLLCIVCSWLLVSLVSTRKDPKVLLSKAAFPPLGPQGVWMPGLFSPGAGPCICLCGTSWDLCLPNSSAWDSSEQQHTGLVLSATPLPALYHCKLVDGALWPIIQVFSEKVKHYWHK